MIKWKQLLINLFIPLAVGGASAFITRGSMDIYSSIVRPPLSPPAWLFPVVWTVLYILMGAAAYLVTVSGDTEAGAALRAYAVQLFLNFIWSPIFFVMQNYGLALLVLILLLVAVIITAVRFCRIDSRAGWLLLPYILWLLFAGYLNAAIWYLNP